MTQPLAARRWWQRDHLPRRSWVGRRREEFERGLGHTRRQRDPRTLRVVHGVPIEYSPNLNGDPDPGEVVWTWVPYREDQTRGKDRPVVVIGRTGDVLAGVPLTSKDKGRDDHVPVGTGAWDPHGRPSWAKVDRLITFRSDDVRREGDVLPRPLFDDVIDGLSNYHEFRDIPPPPSVRRAPVPTPVPTPALT
jgi:PemK-like, MazF-like toxin of type II toxin-antitoxin system